MSNKILLTGSTGFLGTIIMKEYSHLNIKGLSRNNSDFNVNLDYYVPFFDDEFDTVIHCAGRAHVVPKRKSEKLKFNKTNINGTINLLNGLEKLKPKKFVFISSVSVYGLTRGEYINETYPLLANDPYGKSKIEAEKVVNRWCDEHNVICTILRLPLIVGVNPPGNLGAMIKGIKKGYYFNIAGGKARKSMVLASDVAKIIFKASEVGGTYNLTDGFHPTVNDLSKSISLQLRKSFVMNIPFYIAKILANFGDLFGSKFPINSNKLYKITSTLTFDDSKARNTIGWNPASVISGFKIK
jgi:nucleoside-diphosphate-sugar epimerase